MHSHAERGNEGLLWEFFGGFLQDFLQQLSWLFLLFALPFFFPSFLLFLGVLCALAVHPGFGAGVRRSG